MTKSVAVAMLLIFFVSDFFVYEVCISSETDSISAFACDNSPCPISKNKDAIGKRISNFVHNPIFVFLCIFFVLYTAIAVLLARNDRRKRR